MVETSGNNTGIFLGWFTNALIVSVKGAGSFCMSNVKLPICMSAF